MTDAWTLAHMPAHGAAERNERRAACAEVARVAARLPRLVVPLTQHFDWDRLVVNVYAKVAPGLVTWR